MDSSQEITQLKALSQCKNDKLHCKKSLLANLLLDSLFLIPSELSPLLWQLTFISTIFPFWISVILCTFFSLLKFNIIALLFKHFNGKKKKNWKTRTRLNLFACLAQGYWQLWLIPEMFMRLPRILKVVRLKASFFSPFVFVFFFFD